MLTLLRSLLAPFCSLVLLSSASGLLNTFISVRLEMENFDNETIGFVTASLYFGLLVGALGISKWIAKWGHIRSHIVFASTISLLILAKAVWIDPYYWAGLRFIGGVSMAGIFVTIESWFLMQAGPSLRGAVLSIYLAAFYGALSLGQLLIHVADPATSTSFFLTAGLTGASILPLIIKKISQPKIEAHERLKLKELFHLSPLGFLGGVVSGMLLAVVHGLVPVYAKEIGLSVAEIGNLMALIIFGGLSFQWPISRWADRSGDRRPILIFASLCTAITGVGIALMEQSFSFFLLALVFVFGGFSFTIYPLSMAHTCQKLPDSQIVPATGGFVLSYGIGAIAGPLLAPMAMALLGASGLFYFMALIASLLAFYGLKKPVAAPD